ncbi:MAG: hypothetical protein WCI77_02035 [Candidatus Omnitrophota bacterium]
MQNSLKVGFNRNGAIFILSLLSFLYVIPAYSAKVFCLAQLLPSTNNYYNSSVPTVDPAIPANSFSLSKRWNDLFDFSSYGEYGKERSGRISGAFSQEIDWQNIGGNHTKSFLTQGMDYLSELHVNIQEKLWSDYNFESRFFIRKTDNKYIDPRRDARLKEFNLRVLNSNSLYELGNIYADFSQFVLGSSLEGYNIQIAPNSFQKYYVIAAREHPADESAAKFQRNFFGGKADFFLFKDSNIFSNFRVGLQGGATRDDGATLEHTIYTQELRNLVGSIDGEISFIKIFSLQYEIARSGYVADYLAQSKNYNSGTAFRVQPALNFDKFSVRYLYYYVQPEFYTNFGSASADKRQQQVTVDYRFNDKADCSFIENYYYDRLADSLRDKRTVNNEKYLNFNFRPFTSRRDLNLRPYINYLSTYSDDDRNSLKSKTKTVGFSVNDTLSGKTTYGLNYEYRAFEDGANDKAMSEWFQRVGVNLGNEQQLLNRRLYYYVEPSMDIRRTKTDDDKDINFILSFSGQYDMYNNLITRFGYNLQNTDSAVPDQDFVNNRSFFEFDFLLSQKRSTHVVFRAERNWFKYDDSAQDYNETRTILKFITNF